MRSVIREPRLSDAELAAALHPEVSAWFFRRFGAPSSAQRLTWPELLAGHSTLLSSPTGTGKTLAAFLAVFDALGRGRDAGRKPAGPVAIYVSPLRALTYDLEKNLRQPLAELGWDWVRIGVRTGDTSPAERAAQRRKPPHLLLTTPESLTLLLSQPGWMPLLRDVRHLIVDELHALAENKRGALLMVSAERLEEVVSRPLVRVGLSATVAPLDRLAAYLVGPGRPCRIAEAFRAQPPTVEVYSPLRSNAYPAAGYTATRIVRELAEVIERHRTTLLFTQTRAGAEALGLQLRTVRPDLAERIEVHHASLDRGIRLEVEDRLRRGDLRAVVCSTSLELGLDLGTVDLVAMISAPKGVSRALQRLGRSGHALDAVSRGLLVASNLNDLAECAATARLMLARTLDPVVPPVAPLDVLAQTLVGLAVFGSMTPDEAYQLVRRSAPFSELARPVFDRVLDYLEGGGRALAPAYRDHFGKVRLDPEGRLVLASPRVARMLYQNIGTISSDTMVNVRLGQRALGQLEESFASRLQPGDTFVLHGRVLRLVRRHLLTLHVKRADRAAPTVPRWNAQKMPLSTGVAAEVARLRTGLAERSPADGAAWLQSHYALSPGNATALTQHFALQARISAIPTDAFFLIERYGEGDVCHWFFHTLAGRTANDALARIVASRLAASGGGNALATLDDYGFLLTMRGAGPASADDWRPAFQREGAEDALRSALATSTLVRWQFRGVAQTGLMVPRRVNGAERGARSLQFSAEIIFDVLSRHEPDHPLLHEAYAEATHRFLDLPGALAWLERCQTLPWRLVHVDRVSPFSFGLYVSKIKESLMLEDPDAALERLYHEMYGSDLTAPDHAAAR